jgi:hypothetical protein
LQKARGEVVSDIEGLSITVSKADGEKCERCWATEQLSVNVPNIQLSVSVVPMLFLLNKLFWS